LQDLNKGELFKGKTGACGMRADQTLGAAIIMRFFEFTYEYSSKIEQICPQKGVSRKDL
jgi:hypothetical protein